MAGPGSQSYDSHSGQLGGKAGHPYLLKVQIHSALSMQVCKTGDLENACRALKGFGLVTCRQVPVWNTASSLGPESCLEQIFPKTRITPGSPLPDPT